MTNFSLEVVMDGVLDITDDLDVYVEEDNNNNLDAKEEEDNNIDFFFYVFERFKMTNFSLEVVMDGVMYK